MDLPRISSPADISRPTFKYFKVLGIFYAVAPPIGGAFEVIKRCGII